MATKKKLSLAKVRKIPASMKKKIEPYITESSRYSTKNGLVLGLRKPSELMKVSKKASGVSFGANKDGFFVYTHRARSKAKKTVKGITKKEINFIESTG
jgi:hypothetical protein